jgi:peptidoglycan hydrolase-like protein with peptidoglycan-binding domain
MKVLKPRRHLWSLLLLSLAFAFVVENANPASAMPLQYRWEDTPYTIGDCGGLQTNEYVRWVQAEMWVMHRYANMNSSNVDGVWGNNTRNAVKGWQSANGYAADGCVGWYTRASFRRYPWLTDLYTSDGTNSYYRLQGPYSEYVSYALNICWVYQWFDGWHRPTMSGAGSCTVGGGSQENAMNYGWPTGAVGNP